ncbi:DoxX family protein [Micromonospora sp. KC721]|uniref:DoxX family protein n=1 Tax=Micromonospora sp. KC721 TaxID=2530380 RepID=UPI00104675EC|nr:DoxX family protein [Micromonospora sp. KC721]TDB74055.1 DoxX family protein [Micromonospora sp. KC721]
MTPPTPVRDVVILLARVGIGIVFFAHGWQKLVTNGIDGTAAFFDQAGVPLPTLSAWFAALVELIGGAALIVGAGLPIAGLLLAVTMAGAFLFVHAGKGLFIDQGGYEYVLTLGAASLLLAAVGASRFSVDHLLFGRRTRAVDTARS